MKQITFTINYDSKELNIHIIDDKHSEEVISLACDKPQQIKSIMEESINILMDTEVTSVTLEMVEDKEVLDIDRW